MSENILTNIFSSDVGFDVDRLCHSTAVKNEKSPLHGASVKFSSLFSPCVSSMGAATNNLQHVDKSHDRLNHINFVIYVRFS